MKSQIYNQARYYEIAFSFIDPQKQADLFEQFINKYGKRKVKTVLDLACGTALQLREMAKRGYDSIGLDNSSKMLDFLKKESLQAGIPIKTVKADMNNFKLKQKVDFAYIMMGSIIYVKDNKSFLSHLNSVAQSLNSGGLYLIENMLINGTDPAIFKPQSWTMKQSGIKVKTTWQVLPKDPLKQIVTVTLKMEVDDNGKKAEFFDQTNLKIIFPAELRLLLEVNDKFEFIGFFEKTSTKPLQKISPDNIVLLRRK